MAASKSSRTRTSKPTPVRSSPTLAASPVRAARSSGASAAPAASAASAASAAKDAGAAKRTSGACKANGAAEVAEERNTTALAPTWLQWLTFVIALIALAASAYLTYQHYTAGRAFFGCADKGAINCEAVTTSAESRILGIPVALLGLLFYAFLVPVMSPWLWRLNGTSLLARWLPIARVAAIVVGIGMVIYLLYAELFMIRAICLYCTSVHIATFLLFLLTLFAAGMWGLNPNRTDLDY